MVLRVGADRLLRFGLGMLDTEMDVGHNINNHSSLIRCRGSVISHAQTE